MVQEKMRSSSTTFYMTALAVADTLVLVFGCLRRWIIEVFHVELLNASPSACAIINFLSYWSFDVAAWILVIMTLDKLIIVASPMRAHMRTRRAAAIALSVVVVVSAGINLHIFFTTEYNNKLCKAKDEFALFYANVWPWIDAAVYSFVPFISLLVLNVIILFFVGKANKRRQNMAKNSKSSNHALTVMLLSITFAFLILTAPAVVIHILREKGEPYFNLTDPSDFAKYTLTRQVSRVLLYLNHSINFFLYCVAGPKFRNELKLMFSCQSRKERIRKQIHLTYSQSHTTATAADVINRQNSKTIKQSETVL
ncbi:hypothetical protein EB796_013899 [Bugula neritina]|uniref:G-protein coupled receptors family 1 profile domain-containing protein n=1 Tax=Bugula neritina TaxID=10212 RepID=A0A7J7JQ80_BUGNE|nr:hypothetical protein EB796_013899 [Bugula neritina]